MNFFFFSRKRNDIAFLFIAKEKNSLLQDHTSMEGEKQPATNRKTSAHPSLQVTRREGQGLQLSPKVPPLP
jgi:hypothetical protein